MQKQKEQTPISNVPYIWVKLGWAAAIYTPKDRWEAKLEEQKQEAIRRWPIWKEKIEALKPQIVFEGTKEECERELSAYRKKREEIEMQKAIHNSDLFGPFQYPKRIDFGQVTNFKLE